MTADELIAQLDRFLAEGGEDVSLVRVDDDGAVLKQATVRARVDRLDGSEAPAGIKPASFSLIVSPTPLLKAGWPDGNAANITPQENGPDKVAFRGMPFRTVIWANGKRFDNRIVRIELKVSG